MVGATLAHTGIFVNACALILCNAMFDGTKTGSEPQELRLRPLRRFREIRDLFFVVSDGGVF
jgi:hypothetical protein